MAKEMRNKVTRIFVYGIAIATLPGIIIFIRPVERQTTTGGIEIGFTDRPVGFRVVLPERQWLVVFPLKHRNLTLTANSTSLRDRKNFITTALKKVGLSMPMVVEMEGDQMTFTSF